MSVDETKMDFTREEAIKVIEEGKILLELQGWTIKLDIKDPKEDEFLRDEHKQSLKELRAYVRILGLERVATISLSSEIARGELTHNLMHEMFHIHSRECFKHLIDYLNDESHVVLEFFERMEETYVRVLTRAFFPEITEDDEAKDQLEDLSLYASHCCEAEVRLSDMSPDFIGDDPATQKVGTCHFICTKCEQACTPVLKEE